MTKSIGDILQRSRFDEPPEIQVIKDFVLANFGATVSVIVRPSNIVISVRNASLAGALRLRLHELQALCQTDKKLVIRIS
jgi:hypothetical protein